jgi:hypothetical protein
LPDNVPKFQHGYSWDERLWINEQPSDYYRRHLLLHEGTHAFMNTILGGCGPAWYREGMAEYFGTHRWHDGQLTLAYMPRNRDEVLQWGRIRIIQDAVAKRQALRLKQVIEFPLDAIAETEFYAWTWAAITFLDKHLRYQERFRRLLPFVQQNDFTERFYRDFKEDWQELCEEWQLMVVNLEYGYDVARCAVDFTPGKPISDAKNAKSVTVAADRGWQNSGLQLESGKTYSFTAAGRYQVAKTTDVWWSEPNGVSIRYYRGQPLGILLTAVRPARPALGSSSALLRPIVVGLHAAITPTETGTLFFKINDSAGELDDNQGTLHVHVQPRP